ncbi:8792_t:CDS:2 [Scutellospora calospora]|uniref:8792_t:CDS:1 n=1 Tax=Scutellospora calospora TaxID=85575 RepID=A0ACA9LNW4_9GLOM|nr:8792_t:CDS:2 [Scutellospora calospora]
MIMIPPQNPRIKTKLSLDTNYSNLGSPASPSSPCYSPIASPTLSGSWNMNANKSHAELTASLKEAYNLVKEKERDLTLAAEIGKSLLENNIALKAKYEEIVLELQQLQRQHQKKTTFIALHAEKPNVTSIAPPNTYDDFERDDSDSESHISYNSGTSFEHTKVQSELRNRNKKNDQTISYKDLENIRELEGRNQVLQSQLDELTKEYIDSDKANKTKIRKLEADLLHYQEVYSSATHQIEVLEQENERLLQKQKSDFWNLKYNKKTASNDEDLIESLMNKVSELESQNNTVERAKTEIEKRLQRVVQDLESLQEQYDELSERSRDFELLKVANHEQELLINELNESLEEQRAMIVGMRSNAYSRNPSRSNSFSYSDNGMMSNALRRISNPPANQNSQQGLGGKIKTTLLSELENVW